MVYWAVPAAPPTSLEIPTHSTSTHAHTHTQSFSHTDTVGHFRAAGANSRSGVSAHKWTTVSERWWEKPHSGWSYRDRGGSEGQTDKTDKRRASGGGAACFLCALPHTWTGQQISPVSQETQCARACLCAAGCSSKSSLQYLLVFSGSPDRVGKVSGRRRRKK